jgi:hypothetical protein
MKLAATCYANNTASTIMTTMWASIAITYRARL